MAGMSGVEVEEGAAVLQAEPEAVGHGAGAEARVIALDERDEIAVLVGNDEVGRLPRFEHNAARRDFTRCFCGINEPAPLCGIFL
jgi:hypothetical protein